MSPLSIVFPALLLLAAIASELGARGPLHRNRFFGVRMQSTLASDEAWAAGHRASALPSWIGFVLSALVGLAAWFSPSPWLLAFKVVLVLIFAATVIVIFMQAGRAARANASAAHT